MFENLSKKQKSGLGLLLAATFLISISYSFYFRIPPAVDARAYDTIAWNLARGYGYRESLDGPLAMDNAILRVGPGYEFFLAVIYYFFGHHYEIIWLLQSLFLTFSALLVFLISKEIFKNSWNYSAGIIAAALVGLSPDLVTIQAMLMTEALGIFLICLSVYLFCRYLNAEQKSYFSAMLLGFFLALATLVRTPAGFLFLSVAVYFLISKDFKRLLAMVFLMALVVSPWATRNYKVYGEFILTNAASGLNLLTGNHPGASGEQEPYLVLDRYAAELGGIGANQQATKDAIQFILNNPLEFLKLTIYRTSTYFSFARPTGFWFHLQGFSKILTLITSAIYSVLLFTGGFWGIWKSLQLEGEEKNAVRYFLAMLAIMPLVIIGVIVETRYRVLVYPFFAVFAGYGLNLFWQKKLEWQPALTIVLLLGANTLFDITRNLGRILERIQGLTK